MKCTRAADNIKMLDGSLFVLKGFYLFYKGDFDQAINYFDNGRENNNSKSAVTAYIGQACVEFCKTDFRKASLLLKQAIKLNHKASSKLYVALGYCFIY
mmetsp:Transcript_34757/g.31319  ORF Transcript_34757/g.31319 Transcript_34757/m.31319 type:complete len:99 (-) Transcript_34757:92-388(-)